jgi:nucleoside-diphosphate-sugar epimerase
VVIGGSGFIGTSLCSLLSKSKLDFLIYDKRKSLTFPYSCKVSDVRFLDQLRIATKRADVIVNLAAEHKDNVRPLSLYDEVNVGGAINVCEVASLNKIKKIIFTSSVAVYGFAKPGTNELGKINPFNDYGRTKWEAEEVLKVWQQKDPVNRSVIIIRPTVVFGKNNRGNVYNLFRQIYSGKFVMVGDGQNRKSIAYVENVAAFIKYSFNSKPGVYIYNYTDKPDYTMNSLILLVKKILGRSEKKQIYFPYWLGLIVGKVFDFIASFFGRNFSISAIRVKKFCSNSTYESIAKTPGFKAPFELADAIEETVRYEFLDSHSQKKRELFFSD